MFYANDGHVNCCSVKQPLGSADAPARGSSKEAPMEINWNRDIDAALRKASETGRPLLLDFTAAPM